MDDNVIDLFDYKNAGQAKQDYDRILAIRKIVYEMESDELKRIFLACLREVWVADLTS